MHVDEIPLTPVQPGTRHALTSFRFGTPGARPKIYVQGALHADEIPGMLAARHLVERLRLIEAEGSLRGEVIVVPSANPIGLAQSFLGRSIGRFAFKDGVNFNRAYPDFAPAVAASVEDRIGLDADENVALIREALLAEVEALAPTHPVESLKQALLRLSIDSDVVLDLHCDSEAAMHLYALTPQADEIEPLTRYLGCDAVLLATESGDNPFDEANSRPWLDLQRRFMAYPVPLACIAVTVELRGERDVDTALAEADCEAILAYMKDRGALEGDAPALPAARCEPTPLASVEPLTAPSAGIVLYHVEVGTRVEAGDLVAELLDPLTQGAVEVRAQSPGVFFARSHARFAHPGQRLGKIAGQMLQRSGNLLSP